MSSVFRRTVIAGLLIAALIPAASAAAAKRAPVIMSASIAAFPERVHGISVSIAPDGVPWFGLATQDEGASVAQWNSGKLEIDTLSQGGEYTDTTAPQFDSRGTLWFAITSEGLSAIARRNSDGTVTEFDLPKGGPVNALTFGPEGDIWFVRGNAWKKAGAQIGRMTPDGAVSQFLLAPGSRPTSITVGPDGALWFNEELAGKIGRITTSGEIQLFDLGPKVHPRQIVASAEGALWFSENGQARHYGRVSDRIGRITPGGEVTQFPVPFGKGTSRLAADPSGAIWFATDEGDFSSISRSGNVGARGCVDCGDPIEGLALAPDGSLWFAAGHASCVECGGESGLITANEGTEVGQIPSGALTPAEPDGPPAADPYANQTDHPPPPIARTGRSWGVEDWSAVLTGYVNSRGFPTTWLFRWGKTDKYGHKTFLPEDPFRANEGGSEVEEVINNLCPGTTYHYEIVAYGPGGRAPGGDRAFRTPREKHVPKRCLAR
jgi:virginiamycin B lyase